MADTRAQVARELEDAVSEPRVERLERALKTAETRIAAAETSHSESLSRIGLEITRLARVMDDRISESEKKAEALHNTGKADRELAQRFDSVREENRNAIRKLGEDVSALGQSLNARVDKSESRAAEAIETATRSMSEAVARLEERQTARAQESDLEDRLRQSEERTAKRIEEAIGGISERLEKARTETAESLSPVQRAMNALADRLEAIENRHTSGDTAPETQPEPSRHRAARQEPDFDTPLPPPPDAETPPGYDEDEIDDPFIIAEAATPPSRTYAREPEDDEFLTEARALEEELAAASAPAPRAPSQTGRNRNPSAGPGMILQPMQPVDEPVRQQRPRPQQSRPPQQTAPKSRAPLGATADADFLAAARSRTRGDRTTGFDPYVTENSESGNGRIIMIAASVLGFLAIASAAGMLLYDNFNSEPASAAEALSSEVLGTIPATVPDRISTGEARDTSAPATTPPASPPAEPVAPESGTAATSQPAAAQDIPAQSEPPREVNLQPAPATQTPAPEPVIVTLPTLQQAAASGDPVARYLLGEERLSSGDVAGAAALIRRAAEQNVPAAQYRYAKLLERGEGVEQDLPAARQWTRRAAEAGHRRAMHNLGVMFATGSGGEENINEAARWFEEAALHGLTDSQFNLAVLFQQGQGMPQSDADAYAWFSIAAAGGDSGAGQQAAAISQTLAPSVRTQADQVVAGFTPRPFNAEVNGQYNRNWGATITLDTELIASAQSLLNALGYDAGQSDGQPGPRTEAAVRAFQQDRGLPVTGIIDPALIGRLENARSG